MTNNQNNKTRTEALYNFLGNLSKKLLSVPIGLIIVYTLTQNDYGIYKEISLIIYLLINILQFNFHYSLFYFYNNKKLNHNSSEYINQTYNIMILVSISLIIIGGLIFSTKVLNQHHLNSYFISMIIIIALGVLHGPVEKLFVIENNAKRSFKYSIIYYLLYFIIFTVALLFYGNIKSLIWSLTLIYFANSVFCFIYLKKKHNFKFFKYNHKIIKQLLEYNIWLNLSRLLGRTSMYMDKIIILSFMSSSDFAVYAIGSLQIPLIGSFFSSLGEVIIIRMSNVSQKIGLKNEILDLYKKMIETKAAIGFPVIIFALLISQKIFILVFEPKYLYSARVFNIINLILFIQIFGPHYVIRSLGITKPIFYGSILKFVLSIALGIPLVKFFGLIGAAYSFLLTSLSGFIVQFYYSKSLLKCKIKEMIPIKKLLKIILSVFIASIIPLFLPLFELNDISFLIVSFLSFFGCVYIINKKVYDSLFNSIINNKY